MKKYKPNLHLLSMFSFFLAFATGCTQEEVLRLEDNAKLSLRLNTRAVVGETLNGVTIRSLRILITDSNAGNHVVANRTIASSGEQPDDYLFRIKQGRYKICVVANETPAMTPALAAAARLTDIDAITVVTPTQETDLVLCQTIDIMLRPLAPDTALAEVSTNGGASWVSPPVVAVMLERVASKISLSIQKRTNNALDRFDIKKVELINLASASHLLPGHAYTGGLHAETAFNAPPAVSFLANNEVKSIFSNYVVSEYPLATPASATGAAALVITADYTPAGDTPHEVVYTVPVLGKNAADYSLNRNCHYNITATITQAAESNFTLNIEYEVLPWTNAGDGNLEVGAVTFSGKWETGTVAIDQMIAVSNNTSVTYEFTLSFPPGAKWTAQLTNFQDFDFDLNNNGVREGITATGVVHKVRVRPRAAVYTNDVTTEFYITVFNGIETIEVNLTGYGTGAGKRYIIKQNPN